MDINWTKTAQAIKALRKSKQWSVTDLAARVGRSRRTIENWEQGRPVPAAALTTLKRLAKK